MQLVADISQIASLMADPKRSAMLWALIDGMARPSEELATMAGLTPSSACAHLARLSAFGLLKHEARGRKRYFRLAAPEVGAAVEALASVPVKAFSGRERCRDSAGMPLSMRRARLCGDHLGGDLAADLYERLLEAGWLALNEQHLDVTPAGRLQFSSLGIYIDAVAQRNGRIAESCRCCSQWNDQRPHLGGALGGSVLKLFVQKGWVRLDSQSRALRVSRAGMREVRRLALKK